MNMQLNILKLFLSALTMVLLMACSANTDRNEEEAGEEGRVIAETSASNAPDADARLIQSEPVFTGLLLDADGDVNHSARRLLTKADEVLTYHYQRVACPSDTCRQEFVTYSAVEYPKDSLLQSWMADVLAGFYYDATRQIDILVNGEQTEDNGEGEMVLRNVGCRPYEGVLGDDGRSLFDYYQARVWVLGKHRDEQHGPAGRYGCIIYRCWQSADYVSYLVAYSTDEPQWPVHYVCTFDRRDGKLLDMTDIIRPEYEAEFADLVADAARDRHYSLKRSRNNEIAIEEGPCDYASQLDIKAIGFTADGLAISTGALAFDQWVSTTHILIIPYSKVRHLMHDDLSR